MVLLESDNLPLGMKAIDFTLPCVDGEEYSLKDFAEKKALVVIFMCNHCPYVQAIIERIVAIQDDYEAQGVQVVCINPNDAENYPEDDFDHMQSFADQHGLKMYLHDESQEVARAYKAQCTPDIYLFDENQELAYHGRLDDSWKDASQVEKQELRAAIDAVLEGKKPSEEQRPSMGCSIKWK